MGSRMGTRLPMIFVKGHPAKLHEMTLDQLRKFVPFLVRCETRKDMPLSTDAITTPPLWWPSKMTFSRAVLYEKKPQREMIQRLVKIVSRCYAHNNSSYLIAFSASLANGNCSQPFGKLTILELEDGTTRILNSKGQLVVVVRTTTRHYDREEPRETKKRRQSARLVTLSICEKSEDRQMSTLEFDDASQSMEMRDEERHPKRRRRNLERTCRKTNGALLALEDSPINEIETETVELELPKSTKRKTRGRLIGQVRHERRSNVSQMKLPCKHCGKEFTYHEILEEHETLCSNPSNNLSDVRDDETRKESFMNSLGMMETAKVLELKMNPMPKSGNLTTQVKPGARNLRKVASRSKIGAFIRAHPIPITSERGQTILEQFGERFKPGSFDGKRIEYEKNCNSRKSKVPAGPGADVTTLKKHMIKDSQYVHQFSFSRIERKRRDVELIIGLPRKSFRLLNTCRRFSIPVERLPEAKYKEMIKKRQKMLQSQKSKLINIILSNVPFVKLTDCVKWPESIPRRYRVKL